MIKHFNPPDLLIPLFFVFMHFEVAEIFGYHLTLGAIFGALLFLYVSKLRLSKNSIFWIIALNLLIFITPLVHPRYFKPEDFITTALLVEFAILLLIFSFQGSRIGDLIHRTQFGVKLSFWIVASYSITQLVLSSVYNLYWYNPWGESQFLYQYSPIVSSLGLIRSSGFYLEPSFNAFVICALTLLALSVKASPAVYLPFSLLAVSASQSAIGILVWLTVATYAYLSNSFFRKPAFALLLLTGGITSFGYLAQRVDTIGLVGSSGHYRVLSPTVIIGDLLNQQVLGYPLGSLYSIVSGYQLFQFGSQQAITLDNGFYVIIFYFGWFGLISLILFALWVILGSRKSSLSDTLGRKSIHLWLALSLLFSGAIFAPEFGVTNFLVVSVWAARQKAGVG